MAIKFLEPGGDADMSALMIFWPFGTGVVTSDTDFVHGNHQRSNRYRPSNQDTISPPIGIVADTGARISTYFYFNALPAATSSFCNIRKNDSTTNVVTLRVTSGGVLQLWNQVTAQIGTNGPTLTAGVWYRISIAYTITSTSVNRFEVFVNGVSAISVTNATIATTGSSMVYFGNLTSASTLDLRSSDHYIDDSNSLLDTGDVWVTAKRPFSNGTLNEFTTQIGSGGSGYGSGHASQVNERPRLDTNGWSINSASLKTEEYSIESAATGDIDISKKTILGFTGWLRAKTSTNGITANIVVAGSITNVTLNSFYDTISKVVTSTTYPTGNTDIGMDNNSVNLLMSLAECGVIVAYRDPYPGFIGFF